ncbi:hypothetical protein K443DRAFT_115780, partial [Laccaria amethystina LaAM-08-1]
QKPILVQHIYPRQPPSSDSGSKANGDGLWWSPFGFYVRNRLVAEAYSMFPLSPTFGAPNHASYGSPRVSA